MFKFDLNQVIYYIRDSRVHSARVLARTLVENAYNDWACTSAQEKLFTPFCKSGEIYATCHGLVPVEEAFASKAELATALIGE